MAPLEIYRQSKEAMTSLITEENQDAIVPACPLWTMKDLLAHQVGSFHDVRTGNVDNFGTPQWTGAQVERFRDSSVEEIKRAWDEELTAAGEGLTELAANALPDTVTHEFDVRGALGNGENRDHPALPALFAFVTGILDANFRERGLPALRVVADDQVAVLGEGEAAGELHVGLWEASRAFLGRRSRAQLESLNWSVSPEPWLDHISVFPPRDTDLVE